MLLASPILSDLILSSALLSGAGRLLRPALRIPSTGVLLALDVHPSLSVLPVFGILLALRIYPSLGILPSLGVFLALDIHPSTGVLSVLGVLLPLGIFLRSALTVRAGLLRPAGVVGPTFLVVGLSPCVLFLLPGDAWRKMVGMVAGVVPRRCLGSCQRGRGQRGAESRGDLHGVSRPGDPGLFRLTGAPTRRLPRRLSAPRSSVRSAGVGLGRPPCRAGRCRSTIRGRSPSARARPARLARRRLEGRRMSSRIQRGDGEVIAHRHMHVASDLRR